MVELTIEKSDGSSAFVVNEGGGPQPQAHLTMVLEGYSAPVTAGNFATNVLQKLYLGKTLTVDYTGVLVGKGTVSGEPSCTSHAGCVDTIQYPRHDYLYAGAYWSLVTCAVTCAKCCDMMNEHNDA